MFINNWWWLMAVNAISVDTSPFAPKGTYDNPRPSFWSNEWPTRTRVTATVAGCVRRVRTGFLGTHRGCAQNLRYLPGIRSSWWLPWLFADLFFPTVAVAFTSMNHSAAIGESTTQDHAKTRSCAWPPWTQQSRDLCITNFEWTMWLMIPVVGSYGQ